jgi:hypothetical protein
VNASKRGDGFEQQPTPDKPLEAEGTAKVPPGPNCNNIKVGFFQILRKNKETRTIRYKFPRQGVPRLEFDFDVGRRERTELPEFDIANDKRKGTVDNFVSDAVNPPLLCSGSLSPLSVTADFHDRPIMLTPIGELFAASEGNRHASGFSEVRWKDDFLTAFSVQMPKPDGSPGGPVTHLKSFEWRLDYCASFGPPNATGMSKLIAVARDIAFVGPISDGAPAESPMDRAEIPSGTSANEIGRAARALTRLEGPGHFRTGCK